MKALVTGASSGIGKDIAKYLGSKNIDLVLVARNEEKLEKVKKEIEKNSKDINIKIATLDLSNSENCKKLYKDLKKEKIDILINNASFGIHGDFVDTKLEKDINMIDLNIVSMHILMKLFLKDMVARDYGYILNVSSTAVFAEGPLMAEYYASKAYIQKLSTAVMKELQMKKSKVKLSLLCPGPVDTNFSNEAGIKCSVKPMPSAFVAKYAVDKMFKHKHIIIPGFSNKVACFISRFLPTSILLKIGYIVQAKKKK